MKRKFVILTFSLILSVTCSYTQSKYPDFTKSSAKDEIVNQLSEQYMPVIGVWNWSDRILQPDGFKNTIDRASMHSPFNLLIPFLRFPDKEVVKDNGRGLSRGGR